MLRFLTAGESHGQALVTIPEGMPAGLAIDFDAITTATSAASDRVVRKASRCSTQIGDDDHKQHCTSYDRLGPA